MELSEFKICYPRSGVQIKLPEKRNTYNPHCLSEKELGFPGAPFRINHIPMLSGSVFEFRNPKICSSCRGNFLREWCFEFPDPSTMISYRAPKSGVWNPRRCFQQILCWRKPHACPRYEELVFFEFSKTLSLWLPDDFRRNDPAQLRGGGGGNRISRSWNFAGSRLAFANKRHSFDIFFVEESPKCKNILMKKCPASDFPVAGLYYFPRHFRIIWNAPPKVIGFQNLGVGF